MTDNKLAHVAEDLMKKDPGYFGTFPIDVLVSWLQDRQIDHKVLCRYCDTPLLQDHLSSFNGTTDHLLPQTKYPQLGFDKANGNGVACCSRCNSLKCAFDPNDKDPVYNDTDDDGRISGEKRTILIKRSRDYVQRKLGDRHAAWKHWVAACEELDKGSGTMTGTAP